MVFKDLPLSALHIHADHIPDATLSNLEDQRLLLSVQTVGILQHLLVSEKGGDAYLIIDGARRYLCAKELGLSTVPCIVKPSLDDANYQLLRLMLHEMHKPLTQQEYARCVKRLKKVLE